MSDIPGTSGSTEYGDPGYDLTVGPATDLPIYMELPYYENSSENPIYHLYMSTRSTAYLADLDSHMKNLSRRFEIVDPPGVLWYDPVQGLPYLELILTTIEHRRRLVLLEDILFSTTARLDLDEIFSRHRELFLAFLNKVKSLKNIMIRIPSDRSSPNNVNAIMHILLTEYHDIYAQFAVTVSSVNAAYQEAANFVDQHDLIPEVVQPYLRLEQPYQQPDDRIIELVFQIKNALRAPLRIVYEIVPIDNPYPRHYLHTIGRVVREFPIYHWTPEYIRYILETIKTSIDNYSTEEWILEINYEIYKQLSHHRELILEVYSRMKHIQAHHGYLLWQQFADLHETLPKPYFLESFYKLQRHKRKYKFAIQQGIVEFAFKMVSNRPSNSGNRPSSNE